MRWPNLLFHIVDVITVKGRFKSSTGPLDSFHGDFSGEKSPLRLASTAAKLTSLTHRKNGLEANS